MPKAVVSAEPLLPTRTCRYRRGAPIASGGMGRVYCAEDLHTGSQVALKILHPELFCDQSASERFRREAMALRAVDHPGIVSLLDFGRDERGSYFLTMELLEGENLAEILSTGPISPNRAVELGIQAAEALDCVHRAGILHRDLKPANMEVLSRGADDRLVIVDFGLAKLGPAWSLCAITGRDSVWGTPNYMAPELIEGLDACVASEIYSLGCVLYRAIAGRTPREGTLRSFVAGEVRLTAPALSTVAPHVPRRVAAVIDRMVAPEPEARPKSMAEVARELREARARSFQRLARGSEPPTQARRFKLFQGLLVTVILLLFAHALYSVARLHAGASPSAAGELSQ